MFNDSIKQYMQPKHDEKKKSVDLHILQGVANMTQNI